MANKKLKLIKDSDVTIQLKENLKETEGRSYDLTVNRVSLFSFKMKEGKLCVEIDTNAFVEGWTLYDSSLENLTVEEGIINDKVG